MAETYAALLREVADRVAIERETYGSQGFDEAAPAQLRALADLLDDPWLIDGDTFLTDAADAVEGQWGPDDEAVKRLRALAAGPQGE